MVKIKAVGAMTAAAWLIALSGAATAHGPHGRHAGGADPAHGATTATAGETAGELVVGEVRRVDRDRQRITLRHAEIPNLGMSPMTMVFRVRDPAWLDQVRVGDQVNFRAENSNGVLTVTELRPAQ